MLNPTFSRGEQVTNFADYLPNNLILQQEENGPFECRQPAEDDIEEGDVQTDYQNSNFEPISTLRKSDSFVDPVFSEIVDNLMDQVFSKQNSKQALRTHKTKLQKNSNPFLMKNSLNNSVVSTSASEDWNSSERSHSDFCCKAGRSDSLSKLKSVQRKDSNLASEKSQTLFEIPEQSPTALFEWMMYAALKPEKKFRLKAEDGIEVNPNVLNVKKPVPNKFKTEICRNWELEGYCRFGDECTFAHGDLELNKKVSMPSNYKTKICKQFAEEPFYWPYGEKCQFLHTTSEPIKKTSNRAFTYSEILNEATIQKKKTMNHLDNLEDIELAEPLFKIPRLQTFKFLTENYLEENDVDQENLERNTLRPKKTALNKKSKEFIMPKQKSFKPSSSAKPNKLGAQVFHS
jgi:hypothetical protein